MNWTRGLSEIMVYGERGMASNKKSNLHVHEFDMMLALFLLTLLTRQQTSLALIRQP